MQITRETDYAIRCVLYLTRKPGTVIMVEEVAREMHIPRTFLAKIVQKLRKAGIVRSRRGVKGGVELSRRPSEITILDVVEAMQEVVAMNICAVDAKNCRLSGGCAIHPVWVEARRQVETMLREKNFADLAAS